MRDGPLAIALSRSIHKASFRWAEKEPQVLLERQDDTKADTGKR